MPPAPLDESTYHVLPSTFNSSSQKDGESPWEVAERKLKVVNYVSEDHFSVLTQMTGSVWPKVLPYCMANILLTSSIWVLKKYCDIDLTFSDKGHSFMSMLISFLVVTRSNIAYNRFMTAQSHIINCTKSCSELIQHVVCFSRYETSDQAKQWRADCARRTIVLLRTVVSVLQYQSKGEHAWKTPELSRNEKQALLLAVGKSNERSPIVLTLFLRSTIAAHPDYLGKNIHVNKELYLLKFVSDFVSAYHGLMQLVTTPFPFPLVQMARTFLFIWIFTLPFAMVGQFDNIAALLLIIFILTYGFMGIEYVSIELDDPFGDDPCDFDVIGLAELVSEDIYICIYDMDGIRATNDLKQSVNSPLKDLTKNTVKKHQRYSSVDAWQTSTTLQNKRWMRTSTLMRESNAEVHKSNEKIKENGLDLGAIFADGETNEYDLPNQPPPKNSRARKKNVVFGMTENEPLLEEEP